METILIVHGTFADAAEWWKREGSFCQKLNERLMTKGVDAKCWATLSDAEVFDWFGWDGKNSEISRTRTAQELAKTIVSLGRRGELTKIHFVAHSHGGNVLLKALLLAARNLDYRVLGKAVFLGTPFLKYGSLNPSGRFWTRLSTTLRTPGELELFASLWGKHLFVITSSNDEALYVLRTAVELRESAYEVAKKLRGSNSYRRSGSSTVRPADVFRLGLARYFASGIRTHARSDYPEWPIPRIRYGFYSGWAMVPTVVLSYVMYFLHRFILPLLGPIKAFVNRRLRFWGSYFGLRTSAALTLGDDAPFETIGKVSKTSDVLAMTEVILGDSVEDEILHDTLSDASTLIARIYQDAFARGSSVYELSELAATVFQSKRLVHCAYYRNDKVIEMIANIIAGRTLGENLPEGAVMKSTHNNALQTDA